MRFSWRGCNRIQVHARLALCFGWIKVCTSSNAASRPIRLIVIRRSYGTAQLVINYIDVCRTDIQVGATYGNDRCISTERVLNEAGVSDRQGSAAENGSHRILGKRRQLKLRKNCTTKYSKIRTRCYLQSVITIIIVVKRDIVKNQCRFRCYTIDHSRI